MDKVTAERGAVRAEDMTTEALLRAAALLVEKAVGMLSTAQTPCRCCRTRLYDRMAEAKAFAQFTDTPRKLREAADSIEAERQQAAARS